MRMIFSCKDFRAKCWRRGLIPPEPCGTNAQGEWWMEEGLLSKQEWEFEALANSQLYSHCKVRKLDLKGRVWVWLNIGADEEIVGETHEWPIHLCGSQEYRQDDIKWDRGNGTEWRRGCGISWLLQDLTTQLLSCGAVVLQGEGRRILEVIKRSWQLFLPPLVQGQGCFKGWGCVSGFCQNDPTQCLRGWHWPHCSPNPWGVMLSSLWACKAGHWMTKDYSRALKSNGICLARFWIYLGSSIPFFPLKFPFWNGNVHPMLVPSLCGRT